MQLVIIDCESIHISIENVGTVLYACALSCLFISVIVLVCTARYIYYVHKY
jgi:hypothetical protein